MGICRHVSFRIWRVSISRRHSLSTGCSSLSYGVWVYKEAQNHRGSPHL